MVDPIEVPERLNLARWYIDQRLDEGLGDKTAIYCGEKEITYTEVFEQSCRAANLLRSLGVRREERVLLILPDCPDFVYAYFGIVRAGCVAVPVNNWLQPADYAYYLDYVQPTAVIVDHRVWPLVERLAGQAGSSVQFFIRTPENTSSSLPPPELAHHWNALLMLQSSQEQSSDTWRDDVCTWLSSSGSTGKPKCVPHMHHDFVWNTVAYAQRTLGLKRDDITLAASKLFFGYALGSNMLFPFSVGASIVLFEKRLQPQQYFELLSRYQATQFITVPTMIAKMLDVPEGEVSSCSLDKLHSLVSAGEALPPSLYRRWKERFDSEIYDGIGSAEMFHIYVTNRPGDVKEGSLGRLVEGYSAQLLNDDETPASPGEIGTLAITGPSAGLGYWRRRDESRQVFRGDTVIGGDKFRIDDEGYFWYCGRKDDLMKCSGMYVSPLEVEDCLLSHPKVAAAGVISLQNAEGLDRVVAFVEAKDRAVATANADFAKELIEYSRQKIAPYKTPREVRFVEQLPRTETGKIKRAELRKLADRSGATNNE